MTLKTDGTQNSLTTLLSAETPAGKALRDDYDIGRYEDGSLVISHRKTKHLLDAANYEQWLIGLTHIKQAGLTLDDALAWSAPSGVQRDDVLVKHVWNSIATCQPTTPPCPHVEQAKQHTIKDLIKMGILTPHLAMQALSRHPALNDQPEWAELVVGELDCVTEAVRQLQRMIHGLNRHAGWWSDLKTGEPKDRNDGELLMLMVSELAEGMEGVRKNLMDDKLPHRKMIEVELADCLIRILDYAGGRGLDIAGAMIEKLAFNSVREDHTIAARQADDGKKF